MKIRTYLLLVIAAITWVSCDNDLVVTSPWKDIPIVHAIITPNDTAHYIRIEKAFLDPNTSALEIAKIADSIYYDELDAALVNTSSGQRFQLTEVDATFEGYPRDQGIFATEPNILYKITADDLNLKANETYRLEINRSESLPLVTAETEVVLRPTIMRPVPGQPLRFVYDQFFRVVWQESDNAFFYDVKLDINYEEMNESTNPGVYESRSLEWSFTRNTTENTSQVLGVEFYEYLAAELEADPAIIRELTGIDVIVNAGGEELYTFRSILSANTGITGVGGDLPSYTNLSEGAGIFTSSNAHTLRDFELHPESLDSLQNGSITGDLNFQ